MAASLCQIEYFWKQNSKIQPDNRRNWILRFCLCWNYSIHRCKTPKIFKIICIIEFHFFPGIKKISRDIREPYFFLPLFSKNKIMWSCLFGEIYYNRKLEFNKVAFEKRWEFIILSKKDAINSLIKDNQDLQFERCPDDDDRIVIKNNSNCQMTVLSVDKCRSGVYKLRVKISKTMKDLIGNRKIRVLKCILHAFNVG